MSEVEGAVERTAPQRPITPMRPLDQVLWECFRHFWHLDHSNAAIHVGIVRYSPITFRLAEHLHDMDVYQYLAPSSDAMLDEVVRHLGQYEEDKGR